MSAVLFAAVPLRQRLMQVAAAAVLPVALAAGAGLLALARSQYREAEAKSLEVTRVAAAAVDLEVRRSVAVLDTIAAAPMLERRDFAGYWTFMTRTLRGMGGWDGLLLLTTDGTPLVDTRVAWGTPPPAFETSESFRRAVASRAPVIGQVKHLHGQDWEVPLYVPVLRDDKVAYVLTALMTPQPFVNVVASQRLPGDWIMSVFDAHGVRVARSREHQRYLGMAPAPSLATMMAGPQSWGTGVTTSLEGVEVYTAYVRMPDTGWTVAIGFPTADVQAAALRAFGYYGGGALLSLLVALLLASRSARRIAQPIAGLREAAERLGRGEVPAIPATAIAELHDLGQSIVAAASARGQLEGERRATLAELLETRDDLRQQVADLECLRRLTNELLQLDRLDDQLHAVLGALCELHDASHGVVSLSAPDAGHLSPCATRGFSPAGRTRLAKVPAGLGACGLALRDDRRVIVEDTDTDPRFETLRDLARAERFRAVHSTPIRGSAGRVLGVIAVQLARPGRPTSRQLRLADLCAQLCSVFIERARAQVEAEKSERRLAVALDSATVPFSILAPVRDGSGTVVDFVWEHVNAAAAIAVGRDRADLLGQCVGEIAPRIWDVPGLFDACIAVVESTQTRELESRTGDAGCERWLRVLATPFDGKVALWSSDVTDRKLQERALQAADRRKDEFLAILAHELRNPLAPIQQAAMIANQPGTTESQQRWCQAVIVRQVKHMSLLLDDLLDVSRITRGKLELRKSRIALSDAIDTAVETARPHFESKGHQLILALPPAPIYLTADALRVAQVITNLLANAARYTEPGGVVRLSARVENRRAVISVTDNGMGIAPAHLESIFEMFSQGRASSQNGGLGIGLALSRGIAQLHGGTLGASSPGPGKGSCFTLSLPLGDGAAAVVTEQPLIATAPALRILVADDNRDAAETLASLLRLNGHQVRVAYDGESALATWLEQKPEAAILDIGMPRLSGYEVAQRIRAAAAPGEVPLLVALTGWGQARDKATAAGAGFDHHLTKPVDAQALFALLAAVRRPAAAEMPAYDLAAFSKPGGAPPVTH